ncbi:hypothetical protein GCM10007079_19980 [Nocardiopsis terrae]|uniref:DUF4097 domain-containing protein n=1 Tax=Nocardiopsis terrae TaxID=372655 RepID=A0ABR9HH75_9ACTN|nr:DUF4097 family beta strand repeat-containing protein [Nocardiopsis terrae]MBE1458386.1 hypothetical protein [Nocardiopsis terrae]GHC80780.1 hypothetical protein GCM10007079_19980 [Nocardiopsis terrae]
MTFRARGLYASSSKERGRFRWGPWMVLGGALVLILVVVTAVSVLGNVVVHQTDRDDSFAGVSALELTNETGGQVTLRGGDGDEVLLERSLRGSPLSEPDEDVDADGDTLAVDTDCDGFPFFTTCAVDYEVTVPAGTRVTVETVSGGVHARGLEGELSVEGVSGGVQVAEQNGDTRIETVSGRITLEGMEGAVTAHSTSGGITAGGEGPLLDVSTTSGTVSAADFTAEEVRAESVSGSLELGGGFTTLEASSTSGSVDIATGTPFDLMSVETVSGRVEASVPEGVYEITGESVSGSREFDVDTSSGADSRIDVNTTSGSVQVLH